MEAQFPPPSTCELPLRPLSTSQPQLIGASLQLVFHPHNSTGLLFWSWMFKHSNTKIQKGVVCAISSKSFHSDYLSSL